MPTVEQEGVHHLYRQIIPADLSFMFKGVIQGGARLKKISIG